MSSRRSRQHSGSTRISDDQIIELVSKLRQLVPEIRSRRSDKVSASKVLQETCNYIRSLHREVSDLSERLSQLLTTIDADSVLRESLGAIVQFEAVPPIWQKNDYNISTIPQLNVAYTTLKSSLSLSLRFLMRFFHSSVLNRNWEFKYQIF
ncbi:hypothetical protein V8G54_018589 [Vigna mungo]|uniref:BHLH domain-containing protein n=1 Tax=Vigna mungo TaxID=3915 RepID=A0AAQ3N9Z1_VIGMU